MICNDLCGFSIDPHYFCYNSAQQENPVLCIFMFQEPSRTQIDLRFFGIKILSREPSRPQEVNEVGHDGQTSIGGAATRTDRATHARLDLETLMLSIFVS
jgi:hypothetical protein